MNESINFHLNSFQVSLLFFFFNKKHHNNAYLNLMIFKSNICKIFNLKSRPKYIHPLFHPFDKFNRKKKKKIKIEFKDIQIKFANKFSNNKVF